MAWHWARNFGNEDFSPAASSSSAQSWITTVRKPAVAAVSVAGRDPGPGGLMAMVLPMRVVIIIWGVGVPVDYVAAGVTGG
jgi:hypothetical protein